MVFSARHVVYKMQKFFAIIVLACLAAQVMATNYNLSTGVYPPCSTSWSVSGSTYSCNGNGRVTLASGDTITSNSAATISAHNGFSLAGNVVGSSSNNINLVSTYGSVDATGTNTINGSVTSNSGSVTLNNTTVTGSITTSGSINLTGGGVSGKVTSSSNTITTNGTNLLGGATAQSGMNITGGTLTGNFVMTSNNQLVLTGVTMTSGSISGASTVTIQSGSVLGSASSSIAISSNSGAITVNNSTVYGNLTAPGYSTVNVTNGGNVYGTCSPDSTPAGACGAAPLPPSPMNCTAGTSSGITGYYYNNRTLTEPSTGTRSDAPIDFNWAGAAPGASGVNADNFSIRWNGYIRATQTGTYRFQTVSDDGVRLYINDTLVIDRWNDHSATTDTTGDFNLVAGNTYSIRLEYYENGGDAVIRLRWQLPGSSAYVAIPGGPVPTLGAGLYECTPVAVPPVASCATTLTAGITGDYFNNQTLSSPVTAHRSDGPIYFDWGLGVPGPAGVGGDHFSVRWDGYVYVAQSGVYRFQTNSDDGVRLTVNGALLIDQWNDHAVTTHTSAAVNLEAGKSYPIKMEFYENGGYAVAQLLWQTPGSSSYVAIPKGTGSSPISAAGLYECVTTPAAYLLTHNATGITCAAEPVTITALNTSGVAYSPPTGTVVALSTNPSTGVWVGGSNPYTFTGSEQSFTRYLQQTTPGTLTIKAESATASNTSTITFVDTVLRIQNSSSVIPIPTQIAGENGNAIAKVISTNPKTGVCEAVVASRTLQAGLGFTCNNPATCVNDGIQSFLVNGSTIAANDNAAAVTYNAVNLTFNANGEAPMTINYSDVGQVTLHGRLKIDAQGNNPELILSASSNAFVVKPHTLAVSSITNLSNVPSPQTTNSGSGFVAAGDPFKVFVQSRNANGAVTPNFGNESTSEKDAITLTASTLEHPLGGTLSPLANFGSFATAAPAGTYVNSGVQWNQVGSIRIMPMLTDNDYLAAGDIPNYSDGNIIAGRFYPDHFSMTSSTLANSCSLFSYMQQPLVLKYSIEAQGVGNNKLTNYSPAYGAMPTIIYVTENADSGTNLQRFSSGAPHTWSAGELAIDSNSALFSRQSPNQAPDGPYDTLQVGLQLADDFDSRSLKGLDMNADSTGVCAGTGCNAIKLGSALEMRFGRLRLDDAFGPESVNLPVNFATEYWTGGFFTKNTDDSCTQILRSAIGYPAGSILAPANLTVPLSGGSTQGNYANISSTLVMFNAGDAGQYFSAPLSGTGSFDVGVDVTAYPWLRFDWNQNDNYGDDTSLPAAHYSFGQYRGNDRVIYWREKLQ